VIRSVRSIAETRLLRQEWCSILVALRRQHMGVEGVSAYVRGLGRSSEDIVDGIVTGKDGEQGSIVFVFNGVVAVVTIHRT